jgi:hypothetical protein
MELDAAIGSLAMKKMMNYSEYVESRLRTVPELAIEIQRLQNLPEDPPAMIKGNLRDILKQPPRARKHTKEMEA